VYARTSIEIITARKQKFVWQFQYALYGSEAGSSKPLDALLLRLTINSINRIQTINRESRELNVIKKEVR